MPTALRMRSWSTSTDVSGSCKEPVPVACRNRSGATGSLTSAGVPAAASTKHRPLQRPLGPAFCLLL